MTALNVNQSKATLYQKIAKVMGKVERVPKNGYNSFHKYKYVQESDLVDHVRKFMVEDGLVLFNNVREYEVNGEIAIATIEFTLCCTDTGESVTSTVVAEGQDKGDKKFYKAMAGATKYYLMKTFLIPTGDDPEADIQTDQQAYGNQQQPFNNNNQSSGNNRSTGGNKKPITDKQLELIKQRINEITGLVDQEEDAIVDSLKERVGEFAQLKDMTSFQASKCIENLTKWKQSYQNRIQ